MPAIKLGTLEESALIAVLALTEDKSYGLKILEKLSEMTGKNQSVGSVYTTLSRLQEKGFVESWVGEPTNERGGRRKRLYRVTSSGRSALDQQEQIRLASQAAYARVKG